MISLAQILLPTTKKWRKHVLWWRCSNLFSVFSDLWSGTFPDLFLEDSTFFNEVSSSRKGLPWSTGGAAAESHSRSCNNEMSKIKRVITAWCHENIFTPHESYFWVISDKLTCLMVSQILHHMNLKNHLIHLLFCTTAYHTIQQQKPATLQKNFCTKTKSCQPFFFAVFLRLQVQPVEEYSNDDAILQFLRRNLGDGFATKKPMPKENMNSNKSSPTQNGGDGFRWCFSSHKIPIYQQKITNTKQTHPSWDSFGGVHPNKTLPTRLMEVENEALQNGEAYRNEIPPTKKFGGSITDRISSPHLLQMPPPQLP